MTEKLIAIDWGTTNRRIYLLDRAGQILFTERDDQGVLAVAASSFEAAIAGIRTRFGDARILCAGMVGSNRGWHEAPYAPVPAGLNDLARDFHWVEPGRIGIVPGLSRAVAQRPDIMRGEEVQILGAVAGGLAPADGLFCQPGTHCKWARVEKGGVVDFTTAMTGEIFAMLRRDSLLADQMAGPVMDNQAFREGVANAQSSDLLAGLFAARAAGVLGFRAVADGASYVSGLLIGADVAARVTNRNTVHLLADARLGPLYASAIRLSGGTAIFVDSHTAFAAGIAAINERLT